MRLYHVIWTDFDEIVNVEKITYDNFVGTTIMSNKAPRHCGDRTGAPWNLSDDQIKEMTLKEISKDKNPEYFL